MRENQNIAHCSVCSEKTHCRFCHAYIPHRLHSTESNFQLFLSQNLPNNMGDICMSLIQNGRRFITHSPTISTKNGQQIAQKFRQKFCQNYWAKNILHTSIKWIFYSLFPYYFQTFQKDFAPILLGTFEHEKVGKKKSHLSVEEVTVHTTYSWNIKWQKCARMGLNGFHIR